MRTMRPVAASRDRAIAGVYDRVLAGAERAGLAADRSTLLAGAAGRVVELGPGTGANLTHLPRGLASLTLVEPSPAMRSRLATRLARVRADDPGRLPVATDVVAGDAARIPVGDGEADTVIMTLVLCSVEDPAAALAETRRILAPGGQLLLLEHVAAADGSLRRLQRGLTPVWRHLAQGCHLDRDTRAALVAAGFDVAGLRPHRIPVAGPAAPAIVGVARAG